MPGSFHDKSRDKHSGDILVVSETMRFPFRRYRWQMRFLRAKVYAIEWTGKKMLQEFVAPDAYFVEEFGSLRRSYHYHGARGITSNREQIFIAGQNVVFVFDRRFQLIRQIHNEYFNGLHEIQWFKDALYVTCAVTDAVLVLNREGEVVDRFLLGESEHFTSRFGLEPRRIDNRLDYRIMHKTRRLYHVNSVQAGPGGIFAGFNHQGALVQIHPEERVILADENLKGLHNAQFSPDGRHILVNDTKNFSLRVYTEDARLIRKIDLRGLGLPIDFSQRTVFRGDHEIRAGWLRGMAFSLEPEIVFLGLSPTCIAAVNYREGKLADYMRLRRNIWVTVHGLHNLSLPAQ